MPIAAGDSGGYTPPPKDKGDKGGSGGGGNADTMDAYLGLLSSGGAPAPAPAASRGPDYTRRNVTKLAPFTVTPPQPVRPLQVGGEIVRGYSAGGGPAEAWGQAGAKPFVGPLAVEKKALPKKTKPKKTYQMTREDYNNLGPEQRAAVDFNTLLIRAREKDIRSNAKGRYDASPTELAVYEKAVEDMFGESGGSELYAPETLGVLSSLDYEPTEGEKKGDDLDDFLQLKAVIREKDLKDMGRPVTPPAGSDQQVVTQLDMLSAEAQENEPNDLQQTMIAATTNMRAAMESTYGVIKNFRAAAGLARSADVDQYGGLNTLPAAGKILGYDGSPSDEEYFRLAFDTMAHPQSDPETIVHYLKDVDGLDDKKIAALMEYADKRSQLALDYDTALGASKKIPYITASEFRQKFGFATKDGS